VAHHEGVYRHAHHLGSRSRNILAPGPFVLGPFARLNPSVSCQHWPLGVFFFLRPGPCAKQDCCAEACCLAVKAFGVWRVDWSATVATSAGLCATAQSRAPVGRGGPHFHFIDHEGGHGAWQREDRALHIPGLATRSPNHRVCKRYSACIHGRDTSSPSAKGQPGRSLARGRKGPQGADQTAFIQRRPPAAQTLAIRAKPPHNDQVLLPWARFFAGANRLTFFATAPPRYLSGERTKRHVAVARRAIDREPRIEKALGQTS